MNPNTIPRGVRDNHRPDSDTVLTPTEARQGSRRFMNLRVLVVSLVLIGVLGLALMTAFTPEEAQKMEQMSSETDAATPSGEGATAPSTP
ncbi:MAG: hypothetical protein AB7S74_08335 [Hyphomicrobium sp.]